MKLAKRLAGICLMVSPLALLFAGHVAEYGVMNALLIWGETLLLASVVALGAYMAVNT